MDAEGMWSTGVTTEGFYIYRFYKRSVKRDGSYSGILENQFEGVEANLFFF